MATSSLLRGSGPNQFAVENEVISTSEKIYALANRILYSSYYQKFYICMAGLSFLVLLVSISNRCPTPTLKFLEFLLNMAMILEVSIRLVALKKYFWKSWPNIIDVAITILAFITLLMLLNSDCGDGSVIEENADIVILGVRYLVQSVRLFSYVQRENMSKRMEQTNFVDLESAMPLTF